MLYPPISTEVEPVHESVTTPSEATASVPVGSSGAALSSGWVSIGELVPVTGPACAALMLPAES